MLYVVDRSIWGRVFFLVCLLARGSLKLLLVVSYRPLARGGFPGAEPRKPPACLVSYRPLTSPRSPKIQRKLTRLPHHPPPSTIPFTISCKSNTEAPPGTYVRLNLLLVRGHARRVLLPRDDPLAAAEEVGELAKEEGRRLVREQLGRDRVQIGEVASELFRVRPKPVITTQTKGAAAAARANTAHARQRIIRRIMVQLIFFL